MIQYLRSQSEWMSLFYYLFIYFGEFSMNLWHTEWTRLTKPKDFRSDKIRRACMCVDVHVVNHRISQLFYRSKSSRYKYFDFIVLTRNTEQRKIEDRKAFSQSLLCHEMPELNACSTVCIECASSMKSVSVCDSIVCKKSGRILLARRLLVCLVYISVYR